MTGKAHPKKVVAYSDPDGKEPFTEWINTLRDIMGRKRILVRTRRLEQGNFGDCKPVGAGVNELRLFFGPGYRVYFGKEPVDIVVLLCGGEKDTQAQDVVQAKTYWKEYQSRE